MMKSQEQMFDEWYSELEKDMKDIDILYKPDTQGKKRIMGGLFGL